MKEVKQEKEETLEAVVERVTKPKQEMVVKEKVDMSLSEIKEVGKILFTARLFSNIQNESQAIAKILKGKELGLGAMTSLEKIYVVNGKTAMESGLMADLIKRTGKYNYKILELSNTKCELEFLEFGKSVGKSSFTIEDAKRAGLTGKDVWIKYTRNMLFGRALSNGARWYAPDAIGGAYTNEELDFENKDIQPAEVITVEAVEEPKKETKVEPETVNAEPVKLRKDEIAELVAKYGKDKLKEIKTKMQIKDKLDTIDESSFNLFKHELLNLPF